ncbi:hypothetical protein GCM10017783_18140 [Deinococcus piscis]|uniref:Lipoprotein n=1 Tax=Deinococcus piscis TaxID=394230 RepID=A0ABQ3KBB3_9DEIO|nr:hypothetical protein GCM10017783_18140 [Deinococcus piscis]
MYKSKRIQTGLTGLLLAGLLVGCTASVTPPPAGQAQAVQGFEVAGQSDIDRRKVTLPPLTTMAVPTTLQAQSAGPSPLPTWTGPRSYRLAYTSLYANAKPQLALNSRGDVYLNTALAGYSEAGLPVLQKLTSNGQLLGSQTAKADPNTYLLNSFVVVTEDDSQREALSR